MIQFVLCLGYVFADFKFPDISESLPILPGRTMAVAGDFDAFYVLQQEDTSVSIQKFTNPPLQKVWKYTLNGEAFEAVDIELGWSDLYVLVNMKYSPDLTIPSLVESSLVPAEGKYNPLLMTMSVDGNVNSSKWIGGCFSGENKGFSLGVYSSDVYIIGEDSCRWGYLEKHEKWRMTLNQHIENAYVEASDTNIIAVYSYDSTTIILRTDKYSKKKATGLLPMSPVYDLKITSSETIAIAIEDTFYELDFTFKIKYTEKIDGQLKSIGENPLGGYSVLGMVDDTYFISWINPSLLAQGVLPVRPYSFELTYHLTSNSLSLLFFNETSVFYAEDPFAYKECNSLCESCFGSSSSECYSCSNYALDKFSCGSCPQYCEYCIGSSISDCISCQESYVFSEKQGCVLDIKCPAFTYIENDHCEECHYSCEECWGKDLTQCSVCKEGYAMNDGICIEKCPASKYEKDRVCLSCDLNCLSCNGPSHTNCTKCRVQQVLYDGECIEFCPAGTYEKPDKECLDCDLACETCNGPNNSNCNQCKDGYFWHDDLCVNECKLGYFFIENACQACLDDCEECTDQYTCDKCKIAYYFDGVNCVISPSCPENSFFDGTGCEKCHENCESCYGMTENDCSSCKEPYLIIGNSCSETKQNCEKGTYLNLSNECVNCPLNCAECSSSSVCTECEEPYFIYEASCVIDCPEHSYYSDSKECVGCGTGCISCFLSESEVQCLSCEKEFISYDFKCLESCPLGTYYNSTSHECLECRQGCSICNGSKCDECFLEFYFLDNECFPCKENCEVCEDSNSCLECKSGYALKDDECEIICDDLSVDSCIECEERCEVCTLDACELCKIDPVSLGRFTLNRGQCSESIECLPGMSLVDEVCKETSSVLRNFVYFAYYLYRAFN